MPHHDVRVEAREVELVDPVVHPDRRQEDHPAPVGRDQVVPPAELLGPVLLPRNVGAERERGRHLHRGEAGSRRLPHDGLEREPREPGGVHEPGDRRVVVEERVLPVDVEPPGSGNEADR